MKMKYYYHVIIIKLTFLLTINLIAINLGDPVSQLYVFGEENQYLVCVTYSERLSIWNIDVILSNKVFINLLPLGYTII
jgi:hypothetical protein